MAATHNLEIPPEAVRDLKALIESYERLKKNAPHSTPAHAGSDEQIEILKKRLENPRQVWWTDLVEAEICVLDVLGAADLRSRVSGWRRRLQEVVGPSRYAQYAASAPDPVAADPDVVRADVASCIYAVYYFYGSYAVAARSRSIVTRDTFRVAGAILAIQALIAIVVAVLHQLLRAPLPALSDPAYRGLEYVIGSSGAAVLGSIISVQTRLQDPKVDADPFFRYVQTSADKLSIAYVSPLFAAIFGLCIFGLIASGLIGGSAFPKIDDVLKSDTSIAGVALLLIYGFLSGFAERLVPDALNRIAARTLGGLGASDEPAMPTPAAVPARSPAPAPSPAPAHTAANQLSSGNYSA
jgi:hypothetical protein